MTRETQSCYQIQVLDKRDVILSETENRESRKGMRDMEHKRWQLPLADVFLRGLVILCLLAQTMPQEEGERKIIKQIHLPCEHEDSFPRQCFDLNREFFSSCLRMMRDSSET